MTKEQKQRVNKVLRGWAALTEERKCELITKCALKFRENGTSWYAGLPGKYPKNLRPVMMNPRLEVENV